MSEDLEIEYVDACATQLDAQREYAAAKALLKAAMDAMNRASINRLRAAAQVNAVVERLRAEGKDVPIVLPKAAA